MHHFKQIFFLFLVALVCSGPWAKAFAQDTFLIEGHTYTIKNVATQKFLSLQASYTETAQTNATPLRDTSTGFTLRSKDGKYYLKASAAGSSPAHYVTLSTNGQMAGWNTGCSTSPAYIWEFEEADGEGNYYIHSVKGYLKYDGNNQFAYTNANDNDKSNANNRCVWRLEDVTVGEVPAVDYTEYDLSSYTNLPALYTTDNINAARAALATATSDADADAAIEALKATAHGRAVAFSSTGRGGAANPHYIYRRDTQLTGHGNSFFGTGVLSVAAPTAVFLVEYVEGQGYKFCNTSTGEYLSKTQNDNTMLREASSADAGLYEFVWSDGSNYSIKCLNPVGSHLFLHEETQGIYVVAWDAYSAPNSNPASRWNITPAQIVTVRTVDAEGHELQPAAITYFIGNASITAPAIEGYQPRQSSQSATSGTLTFVYDLKSYTVTYEYYNVETPDNKHSFMSYTLTHGASFPEPDHICEGRELIGVPTGKVTSDAVFRIYCFDPATAVEVKEKVNITYAYYGNGQLWHKGASQTVTVGEAYPALDAGLPATIIAAKPAGAVTGSGDIEVPIHVTTTIPFHFSDSYDADAAHWYTMKITDARTSFNYVEGDSYMSLSTTNTTENKHLFTFVGNPFTGYSIYNKEAGAGKILSSTDPAMTGGTGQYSFPVMTDKEHLLDGGNTHWDLTAVSNGFVLSRHDQTIYVNSRADSGKPGNVLAYWTDSGSFNASGSRIYIEEYIPGEITVTSNPVGVVPAVGKVYRIYNNGVAGRMITETEDYALFMSNKKAEGRLSQMWVLHQNGDGYSLMNAATGRYIQPANAATTTTTATKLYLPTANFGNNRFSISAAADASGKTNLNTNANRTDVLGWSIDGNSAWVFEEVESTEISIDDIKAHILKNSTYVSLTPGNYYRLSNKAYTDRYMVDEYTDGHGVAGRLADEVPSQSCQIWQIVADGDKYYFRNAFTGRYIADQGNQSKQFTTAEDANSAKRFVLHSLGGDDWTAPSYAFSRGTNATGADAFSLHCASSQSNTVVAWTYTDNNNAVSASYWNLEPVTITDDDLVFMAAEYDYFSRQNEIIAELNASADALNAKLLRYFSDLACTEIAPSFKRLTNTQLKAILAADGLPDELQQMVVNVKNDSWELDPERNRFTKLFRIWDYEIYTDRDIWRTKTGVGSFAMFCNPTGVTVRVGEPVYIFVNELPADPDVKVGMYVAKDTEYRSDAYVQLHAGLNIWSAPKDGELIVDYRLANADKKWTDYKPLRIHIEGGHATGCWDATRKMTEEDWQWLSANAFESRYLHVKGESTLLNVLTDNVRGAKHADLIMKGWDYCFDGLQRMIGNDGQWKDYYRPMINPRHSYSGNPNWGGQSGSNHPSITRNYLFNLENFVNGNVWEILHEEGHGHQYVINCAGMTEISNNSLSQMVSYEWGLNYSRGENASGHTKLFNYQQGDKHGWSWVDYMRYAKPYYDYSLHIGNQMLYRLYLYFKVTGIMPDFIARLHDELRSTGGIPKGNSVARPTIWTNDYMKLALACCKVSQTDLSEFFETYGMFKYYEDVMSYREQDDDPTAQAQHIRYIGDYGGYYMKMPSKTVPEDVAEMERCIAEMKSYSRKGDNIMFLEDRIKTQTVDPESPVAKLWPSVGGKEKVKYWNIEHQGDFGQYTDYVTPPAASDIYYTIGNSTTQTVKAVDTATESTIQGRTITIQGEGLCGIKIYDKTGKLIYIANTRSFFVPTDVANKLQSGDCTLVVALPDMTDIPFVTEVGDMNHDGRITIADLAILVRALRVTKTGTYRLDQVDELKAKIQQAQYTE